MKTDLKADDAYRGRVGEFREVELPERSYLAIDGHGDPNTEVYRRAIEAMYPVAYRVKFASKAAGRDYVVPPLEALWSADDPSLFTTRRDKSTWDWTLLTALPEWLTPEAVEPHLEGGIRIERIDEGLCVQTLHVGSYDDEGPVLARLHDEIIPSRGLRMTGRHHEIYLSDARRVAPEKLRTILRQPVARV